MHDADDDDNAHYNVSNLGNTRNKIGNNNYAPTNGLK